MHYSDQIKLAETYVAHMGGSTATISNKIVGHARHFKRLKEGGGCTLTNAKKVTDWFDANWPADLEWPEGIQRPSAKKVEDAA
ncbi:hypothetical protein [Tropicimonas sp. S265A]|uniref:hypothetical protein n=1 Tax=Tropicimonas sp. S265A TaxID=3415134 RepID=UPI003C7CFDEA